MILPRVSVVRASFSSLSDGALAVNSYNGVLTLDRMFLSRKASLEAWKAQGIRGVWITVPIAKGSFIGIAADVRTPRYTLPLPLTPTSDQSFFH